MPTGIGLAGTGPEYLDAAKRSDFELGRLLDAVGVQRLGARHDRSRRASKKTMPIQSRRCSRHSSYVRSPGRIAPASVWDAASTLDVAPTVADLCGFKPDPH